MRDPVEKYLTKHADAERWPLDCPSIDGSVRQVVVIPVHDEQEYLPDTLESLARNPGDVLSETLIICVVNNTGDQQEVALRNEQTIRDLHRWMAGENADRLRIGVVDASSRGREFPAKQGVGLARKIGMDWACRILMKHAGAQGLMFSLDADTIVEPNYLSAPRARLGGMPVAAGVVDFAHLLEGPEDIARAIVCYELFLRHYVLGLRVAQSPYAFHTVGSTMVCTVGAYAAVAGMNRRQGGEDFYFLQKLAKTCSVARLTETTVHPSPRPSGRVPFGTGPRVRRFIEGAHDEYLGYHPESFRVLSQWLERVNHSDNESASDMLSDAGQIHTSLPEFLRIEGLPEVWERLRRNAASPDAFRRQAHRWFDGLKTLKLFHFLRDRGYADTCLFGSLGHLMRAGQVPGAEDVRPRRLRNDFQAQLGLLEALRSWEKLA